MQVAEFYALFRIVPSKKDLADVRQSIGSVRRMLLGFGAAFAGGSLIKSFIRLNSEAETAKNQIAGTLALAKNTSLSDELGTASRLYNELRAKAAELPGTTGEYMDALGRLAHPLTQAGFKTEELAQMTVNAVVASKSLNVQVGAGLRDIDQALRGSLRSVDVLTTKLLANTPWSGEHGRKAFNALSRERRAQIIRDALSQKQIIQLANAQADSFAGRADKIRESVQQMIMRVGAPLFRALGDAIKDANTWLAAHQAEVQAAADAIGGALSDAFALLRDVVTWIIDHVDQVKDVLWAVGLALGFVAARAAALWLVARAPFLKLVAALTIAKEIFDALKDRIGSVGAAIAAAFSVVAINKLISKVGDLGSSLLGLRKIAGGTSAAGSAINAGALAGGLGPAGAAASGSAGGGLAGAAGPIGAVVAGAYLLSELTGGPLDLRSMTDELTRQKQGTTTITNSPTISAPINVVIHGASDIADIRRVIEEEAENQLRHIQAALSGGQR